jgi:hypothetical protein
MKSIEEQVKEIKGCAECAIFSMVGHKTSYLPDKGVLDGPIKAMKIAQNKDKLAEAYYDYIVAAIASGFSNGEIIAGIMQNEEQNKKFNVSIDSVIEALISIKSPINIRTIPTTKPAVDAKPTEEAKPVENTDKELKIGKAVNKISQKLDYAGSLLLKLEKGKSENVEEDVNKIKDISKEVYDMILEIDPDSCNEKEINLLNVCLERVKEIPTKLKNFKAPVVETKQENAESDKKSEVVKTEEKKSEAPTNTAPVQQTEAAHTTGGFDIANFVKGPKVTPPAANTVPEKPKSVVFPHQICGLTNDQLVEELRKHFKVNEEIPGYPLYDLLYNRYLAQKMKELDAKQRPNNPFLTQVDINRYVDSPELLAQYSLCFTMPCNNKKQVIVVLFNPTPVPDKNGVLNYPLNIFKTAKKNNNTNK